MTDIPAPDPSATGTPTLVVTPEPSSLLRRLAGLLYDLVAVVAIVMVVGMICQAATLGSLIQTGAHTSVPWWYQLLQYIVVLAYFIVSWLRGGQTLGMRPWRMRLRTAAGGPIGLKTALLRALVVSAPLLLPLLATLHAASIETVFVVMALVWALFYCVALFDKRCRALHDIIVGTELVHFAPPRRSAHAKPHP